MKTILNSRGHFTGRNILVKKARANAIPIEFFSAVAVKRFIALSTGVRREAWWDYHTGRKLLVWEPPAGTDGATLLGMIRANPLDQVTPLIYADWCDDNGRPEAASRIRRGLWRDHKVHWQYVVPAIVAVANPAEEWYQPIPAVLSEHDLLAGFAAPVGPGSFGRGSACTVLTRKPGLCVKRELIGAYRLDEHDVTLPPAFDLTPFLAWLERGAV